MDKTALVSIIIPVYNTGNYLKPCLDSVLQQTYPNLEVIVVDDHSQDPLTIELLKAYAAKDSRINLIFSHENTGCGGCRNKAVAICKGEYLTFLDSDDHLSLDYVERMVQAIETYHTDFVLCQSLNFALPGTQYQFDEKELFFPPQSKTVFSTREFVQTHQLLSIPIMPFAKLFNTAKYRQANISFIPKMFAQDHDWTLRIFCELESFAIVDFIGVYRLVRDNSACHKISEHLCQSVLKALHLRFDLLQKYGYFEMYRVDFFKEAANYFVRLAQRIPDQAQQTAYMQAGFKFLQECGYPVLVNAPLAPPLNLDSATSSKALGNLGAQANSKALGSLGAQDSSKALVSLEAQDSTESSNLRYLKDTIRDFYLTHQSFLKQTRIII